MVEKKEGYDNDRTNLMKTQFLNFTPYYLTISVEFLLHVTINNKLINVSGFYLHSHMSKNCIH